jgi:hypothetical protein
LYNKAYNKPRPSVREARRRSYGRIWKKRQFSRSDASAAEAAFQSGAPLFSEPSKIRQRPFRNEKERREPLHPRQKNHREPAGCTPPHPVKMISEPLRYFKFSRYSEICQANFVIFTKYLIFMLFCRSFFATLMGEFFPNSRSCPKYTHPGAKYTQKGGPLRAFPKRSAEVKIYSFTNF